MSRIKFIFLIFICISTAGCSIFQPFVDLRRNAGIGNKDKLYIGKSTLDNPAICSNEWITDFSELQKIADEECKKNGTGTRAVFDHKTKFSCKLFLPTHTYFKCEK